MRSLVASLFARTAVGCCTGVVCCKRAILVARAKSAPIDINRAKADELVTLKGIGEARATAIIKGRPCSRKDELVQKKILPESVSNESKDQIIAERAFGRNARR
jgi:predicted DNA-binding helix-hairpin-helix protein